MDSEAGEGGRGGRGERRKRRKRRRDRRRTLARTRIRTMTRRWPVMVRDREQ